MNAIHRQEIDNTLIAIGAVFKAPKRVTFGFQDSRKALSVWFNANDAHDTLYVVLPTGADFRAPIELLYTVCIDGFQVFHLCRVP